MAVVVALGVGALVEEEATWRAVVIVAAIAVVHAEVYHTEVKSRLRKPMRGRQICIE